MAEIFISYARSTAAQAEQIAEALRGLGYDVWRDDELPAHRSYAEVIEERLKAARAVVVVWSAEAAKSEWVQSEADRARSDRKLVQLRLDDAALPMPFDRIQCADLSGWAGDLAAPGWAKVAASIADLVGASRAAPAANIQRAGVSICVLPFANMSGDAEQAYFADGISEDIITDLSKVSALAVISRNSSFTFKGKHVDLPQVARQLNVSHVLEGSVRKAGNRVRITAQLIDGATNDHVWAERYDRDLDDIFALQDEISQAIVRALKLSLFPEEKKAIEDRGASSVEAYDLYLRARALLHQQGPAELRRAIQVFGEALALDPAFVPAWRGLHDAHQDAIVYAAESTDTAVKGMAEAAERVLALSPEAWWSHDLRSRQFLRQHRWAEAEAAARMAMTLAPPSELQDLEGYVFVMSAVGRSKEAAAHLDELRRGDPLSLFVSTGVQALSYAAGRLQDADAEYQRSKDLAGDREIPEHFAMFRALLRGDKAAARDLMGRVAAYNTVPVVGLGDIADALDDPEGMLARVRSAKTDPANQDSTRQFKLACWAAALGDAELAVAALRRFAVDLPGARYPAMWNPVLAPARRTQEFKRIARELGLYDYWRSTGNWGDFARPVGEDDFECW